MLLKRKNYELYEFNEKIGVAWKNNYVVNYNLYVYKCNLLLPTHIKYNIMVYYVFE